MTEIHKALVLKWKRLLREEGMDIHTRILISLFISDLERLAPAQEDA